MVLQHRTKSDHTTSYDDTHSEKCHLYNQSTLQPLIIRQHYCNYSVQVKRSGNDVDNLPLCFQTRMSTLAGDDTVINRTSQSRNDLILKLRRRKVYAEEKRCHPGFSRSKETPYETAMERCSTKTYHTCTSSRSRSQGHLARTQPDAISLYTLASAHLSQNRLVLDVTLVIGVDGVG